MSGLTQRPRHYFLASCTRTSMVQTRPVVSKARLTVAPGIACFNSALPDPAFSISTIARPSLSRQTSAKRFPPSGDATAQVTSIRTFATDRGPCLAAFTASSCKTRLNGVAKAGAKSTAKAQALPHGNPDSRCRYVWLALPARERLLRAFPIRVDEEIMSARKRRQAATGRVEKLLGRVRFAARGNNASRLNTTRLSGVDFLTRAQFPPAFN